MKIKEVKDGLLVTSEKTNQGLLLGENGEVTIVKNGLDIKQIETINVDGEQIESKTTHVPYIVFDENEKSAPAATDAEDSDR